MRGYSRTVGLQALSGSSFLLIASPWHQRADWRSKQGEGISNANWHREVFQRLEGLWLHCPQDGGKDAFVHISAVERAGMSTLQQSHRLSYELEQDRRGKTSAVNIESA
jgi:CspA family cold shock protein